MELLLPSMACQFSRAYAIHYTILLQPSATATAQPKRQIVLLKNTHRTRGQAVHEMMLCEQYYFLQPHIAVQQKKSKSDVPEEKASSSGETADLMTCEACQMAFPCEEELIEHKYARHPLLMVCISCIRYHFRKENNALQEHSCVPIHTAVFLLTLWQHFKPIFVPTTCKRNTDFVASSSVVSPILRFSLQPNND